MALTQSQIKSLNEACNSSRTLTDQVLPQLERINVLWNSTGGFASTIQQADLDASGQFTGMTLQQVLDMIHVLTAVVMPDISGNQSQLEQGAGRV